MSTSDNQPPWQLGFVGFLGLMGFSAFTQHEPLALFFFSFFGMFSYFRYRWEPLKYLGILGVVGVLIGRSSVWLHYCYTPSVPTTESFNSTAGVSPVAFEFSVDSVFSSVRYSREWVGTHLTEHRPRRRQTNEGDAEKHEFPVGGTTLPRPFPLGTGRTGGRLGELNRRGFGPFEPARSDPWVG